MRCEDEAQVAPINPVPRGGWAAGEGGSLPFLRTSEACPVNCVKREKQRRKKQRRRSKGEAMVVTPKDFRRSRPIEGFHAAFYGPAVRSPAVMIRIPSQPHVLPRKPGLVGLAASLWTSHLEAQTPTESVDTRPCLIQATLCHAPPRRWVCRGAVSKPADSGRE